MALLDLVTNYIGIIISAVLPVILIWYFKAMERRRIHKDELIATELKKEDEKTARELKEASVDIAADLRKHMDVKIASINDSILDLGKRIDLVNNNSTEISKRVDSISAKQMETHNDQLELISDLQNRADMTNGNIKNIRDDIMDVQELVEDFSYTGGGEEEDYSRRRGRGRRPPTSTRKTRRIKRRRITEDANYQDDFKHRLGSRNRNR